MNPSTLPTAAPPSNPPSPGNSYLGPARVLEVDCERIYIETPDAIVWARLATANFQRPAIGDSVLAISQGGPWFIIGFLSSSGPATLSFPHGLTITAPGGNLRLHAGGDVEIRGNHLTLCAKKVEILARWLWHHCDNLVQKVRGCIRTESKRVEQKVAEGLVQEAGTVHLDAKQKIKLRSPSINLN